MNNLSKKIVWLASYPKSGNTWFRIFLANILENSQNAKSINDLEEIPIASSRSLFDYATGISSSNLNRKEIEDLRPEVYKHIANTTNDTIYFKVHDAWKTNSKGQPLFPSEVTKAVIYIVRNPLDVLVSFSFHLMKSTFETAKLMNDDRYALSNSSQKIGNQFQQALSNWSGHVNSWVHSGLPILVIRYEDMIEKTYETFRSALDFLSIERSNKEIIKAIQFSDIKYLSKMEMSDGFSEKPINMELFFRSGRINEWKEHLDESIIKEIINKHGTTMHHYGYIDKP